MSTSWVFVVSVMCCLLSVSSGITGAEGILWKQTDNGLREAHLETVAVHPRDPDMVYAASEIALYKTVNGGKEWKEIMSLRSTGNRINAIAVSSINETVLFAGTAHGLYESSDEGTSWRRIFKGVGDRENSVLSIAPDPQHPGHLYIGTGDGLFMTKNSGSSWKKAYNLPPESAVLSIAVDMTDRHILYAVAGNGLYRSMNSGAGWKRVLGVTYSDEDDMIVNGDPGADIDETGNGRKLRCIIIDPQDSDLLYIGTSGGVMLSEDRGDTWDRASSIGLISRNIRHLVMSPADTDIIYAATDRGVFTYSRRSEAWEQLYKGMVSSDIHYLAVSQKSHTDSSTLWAVTERGVYKASISASAAEKKGEQTGFSLTRHARDVQDVMSRFAHEPSIEETRRAAILYAEVQPEKIEKWRRAAAIKAWLPDLRVAYDNSKDWQNSTYFYSTSSQKYTDDDVTKGKDRGWAISATWELGELIWNTDQTSIDNRSKLMVQLRDDVLNEVTRIYFERRRLQVEMLLSPPERVEDKIEKELRLQELTASIDALTGGFFSEKLIQ